MPWLRYSDNAKRGCERAAREAANLQQLFLRLPAELRIQICREIFPDDTPWTHHPDRFYYKGGFPPLLHVCRRLRADVLPFVFAGTPVTVHLRDINRKKSVFKHRSFYDILDERSVARLRWIRVKYHSECSGPSPSNFGFAIILIDRATERVHIDSQSSFIPRGGSHDGCLEAWKAYIERLIEQIKVMKLNTWDHHLRKTDFNELGMLKESRPCQLKAGVSMFASSIEAKQNDPAAKLWNVFPSGKNRRHLEKN